MSCGKRKFDVGHAGLFPKDKNFPRARHCLVLMKSHGKSLICNTSLAINSFCFSRNNEKEEFDRKLIETN
jgi:hypothetical protein